MTPPSILLQIAAVAGAIWIGGAAALVTSAELDRRLHPGDYPLPYEVDFADPMPAPDELAPSGRSLFPVEPVEPLAALDACAI